MIIQNIRHKITGPSFCQVNLKKNSQFGFSSLTFYLVLFFKLTNRSNLYKSDKLTNVIEPNICIM